MTSTRYFLYRIAQSFGYNRKNIRLGQASSEMHLLKDAEAYLGKAIWRNAEDIDEVSIEYWNLRKLVKERERIINEITECDQYLEKAHEERSDLLGASSESFQDLIDERQEILTQMDEFTRLRDSIVAEAREIRRSYDGIQLKKEVLQGEDAQTSEKLEQMSSKLAELKPKFNALKAERQAIADKMKAGDERIDAIEAEMAERKKSRRTDASKAFQTIGETNQRMSALRSELGVLDTQAHQLYSEIGKFISRNALVDEVCADAAKEERGLVDVMAAIRHSIQLNHKLAERA